MLLQMFSRQVFKHLVYLGVVGVIAISGLGNTPSAQVDSFATPPKVIPIAPGFDLFATPPLTTKTITIPDPFNNTGSTLDLTVQLQGVPIGPGNTDTVIARRGGLELVPGQVATIPIELVALLLKGSGMVIVLVVSGGEASDKHIRRASRLACLIVLGGTHNNGIA